MFSARHFAGRYFPRHYFPALGAIAGGSESSVRIGVVTLHQARARAASVRQAGTTTASGRASHAAVVLVRSAAAIIANVAGGANVEMEE